MIKTFYGNFLRERFPYKGKIRSEEDSAGARLLNALGSEIEENYRRKISGKECLTLSSSDHAVKELGNLYAYDMTEYAITIRRFCLKGSIILKLVIQTEWSL